jgi:hypothetical protein
MTHPRAASRHPLQGATLADRQSRIDGVLMNGPSAWTSTTC